MEIEQWLNRIGFDKHPFDQLALAEDEPLLNAYFAKPATYDRIAAMHPAPRSGVIYGERGTGKSALCRMFPEFHVVRGSAEPGNLVVQFNGWRPIVAARHTPRFAEGLPHCDAIIAEVLRALAASDTIPWAKLRTSSPDPLAALAWFCQHVAARQGLGAQSIVAAFGAALAVEPARPQTIGDDGDVAGMLNALACAVRGLGFPYCWVLLDGVDDHVDEGPAGAEEAAALLAPLLGKATLHRIDGLAITYFLPSEVVNILDRHSRISHKLGREQLGWDAEALAVLLRERLLHFSHRQISSLNAIAVPDLKDADLDGALIAASEGRPRRLLQLGYELVARAAGAATSERRLIDTDSFMQFRAERLVPPSAAPANVGRSFTPLTPAEARELGELIAEHVVGSPDPMAVLNSLVANIDSEVLKIVPLSGQAPQSLLMMMVAQFNNYRWRSLEHPLVALIEDFRRYYKGKLTDKEYDRLGSWVNRVIEHFRVP